MTSNADWIKRSKFLTQALVVSGALNIGLIATCVYSVVAEKEVSVAFDMQPAPQNTSEVLLAHLSNEEVLSAYSNLSYQELLALLENQEVVEEGYKRRDLALGCLAAFHFFNLEKAVGLPLFQRRILSFIHKEGQEKIDIPVFPGLTEDQYGAVVRYAKTEKWPYTSEGLFFEVQQAKLPRDPSLLEAFYLTSEFHLMETLFAHAGVPLQKAGIVELLAQGDWKILQQFLAAQKQAQDLSPDRLKTLLCGYLKNRSLLAAQILVAWDREFVRLKLEDADLMLLFDLLVTESPGLTPLLKEVLLSPRSDAVRKKASEKLYGFAGMAMPDPYDHDLALRKFCPQASVASSTRAKGKGKEGRVYVVQKGDNLWTIAKKHKVSVTALMEKNRLDSEKLRAGKELIIP